MDDKNLDTEGQNIFNQAVANNALTTLKENLSVYIETIKIYEQLRRVKYHAAKEQGFKHEDAMEIITKTNILG